MNGTAERRKRQRAVMATDSDWQALVRRAGARVDAEEALG